MRTDVVHIHGFKGLSGLDGCGAHVAAPAGSKFGDRRHVPPLVVVQLPDSMEKVGWAPAEGRAPAEELLQAITARSSGSTGRSWEQVVCNCVYCTSWAAGTWMLRIFCATASAGSTCSNLDRANVD